MLLFIHAYRSTHTRRKMRPALPGSPYLLLGLLNVGAMLASLAVEHLGIRREELLKGPAHLAARAFRAGGDLCGDGRRAVVRGIHSLWLLETVSFGRG